MSLVVLHLLLPAYFIYIVARGKEEDQFAWLVKAVTGGAFMLFITLAGRWDWFSLYLRYIPILLFAPAAVVGYRRVRDRPFFVGRQGRQWLGTGMRALEALLIIGALALTVRGHFYAEEPVRLAFPLQDGTYYVGQGGSTLAVNAHQPNQAQGFAADVLELNDLGLRADGIYSQDSEEYAIYGETVYAPCAGTVTSAVDSFPAQDPPERDRQHPAGNHVMITCGEISVLLAHLQQGSVVVAEGKAVATGERLGRVGNTGNTSEPHLHIHAVAGSPDRVLQGDGVPMLLDGEFPVRNTLYGETDAG